MILKLEDLAQIPSYLTYDDVLLLPNYSEVLHAQVSFKTSLAPTLNLDIPIISAPMDTVTEAKMLIELGKLGGLGILHRNLTIEEQTTQIKQALQAGVVAAAAIGVGQDLQERVDSLVSCGTKILCIDSAHGYQKSIMEAIVQIKKSYPDVILIAGNVATYDGAKALLEKGADILRVGMGPGSICTTRVMSGVGVPQLSAVIQTSQAAREFGRHIIADGGIIQSGDIVKALAAGASAVMLGSLLAGTEESPGETMNIQGETFKAYRGMGSVASMKRGSASRYGQELTEHQLQALVPEGVEGLVPFRGYLHDHIHQLLGGIRAGFFYQGCQTIKELQEKARFIRITHASALESRPHSILLNN